MATIPSKQLIWAGTKDVLQENLIDRELGFCTDDSQLYIKYDGTLRPAGAPNNIPVPDETSLFMGFSEDAESYTYDWKSLEYLEPIPNGPLRLWSRIAGMGFFAEVARMDSKGRDISEQLDYANVFIALYGTTAYSEIASAVDKGKAVILSISGSTKFAYLYSVSSSRCIFRTDLSENHTYIEYRVKSNNTWATSTVDIGESVLTPNSSKLITSGAVYDALDKTGDFGWFTSSNVTTEGNDGEVYQGTFSVLPGNDIIGDAIEFEPVETVDDTVFGNVYLNPGIYYVSLIINAQWSGSIAKVCNVMGHAFDFSYSHGERMTNVALRKITQRTAIYVGIPLDSDVPAGLNLWVHRLQIFLLHPSVPATRTSTSTATRGVSSNTSTGDIPKMNLCD